jgi:hypothetical protein
MSRVTACLTGDSTSLESQVPRDGRARTYKQATAYLLTRKNLHFETLEGGSGVKITSFCITFKVNHVPTSRNEQPFASQSDA